MTDTALTCNNLTKSFGTTPAVSSVSFTLEAGQFMALLGPSGCGKTTVLRMIAGLERPDRGEISLHDMLVSGMGVFVPPNQRRVGLVFQDYALFPHMTVEKNVGYGLSQSPNRAGQVSELLTLVGLRGLEKRYPAELSGGQQQRVALARALAPQPHLLLLDEPFSNLDTALRSQVREDVRQIIKQTGISAILVTHDQDEALSIADQIGVMLHGQIQQIGDPRTIYERPSSLAVATFLGEANHVPGEAHGDTVDTFLGRLSLREPRRGNVTVLIRPEDLMLETAGEPNAHIISSTYLGHRQTVQVQLADGHLVRINTDNRELLRSGEPVWVTVRGDVNAF